MKDKTGSKRGRPQINTDYIGKYYGSRRITVNMKYILDGAAVLYDAGDEIPERKLLFDMKDQENYVMKNGILEQIGRLRVQDGDELEDCIYVVNKALEALKAGVTSKTIENAIRKVRVTRNKHIKNPDDDNIFDRYVDAVTEFNNLAEHQRKRERTNALFPHRIPENL